MSSDAAHKLALTVLVNLVVDTQSYRYAPVIARGRKFALAQALTHVYADQFWSSGQTANFVVVEVEPESRRILVSFKGLPGDHPASARLAEALGALSPAYKATYDVDGSMSLTLVS